MSIGDLLQALLGGAGQQSADEEPQADSELEAQPVEPAAGSDLNSMFNSLVGGGQQAPAQSAQPAEPAMGGDMSGLLGALLGGGQQAPAQSAQPAEPAMGGDLSGLLGALLGGGQQAPAQSAQPAEPAMGGDLSSMFSSLVGGGGQQADLPQEMPAAGGDMSGLLGALLGGGGQQATASGTGMGGMGGLLGALLGGGGQAQASSGAASGMGGLLGALLGGGSSSSSTSPIVAAISDKLNIPPAIVQLIVSFVMSKLQNSMSERGIETSALRGGAGADDLEALLQQMSGDRRMAAELAEQTGLDARTAMQGMQEVLAMVGSQNAG